MMFCGGASQEKYWYAYIINCEEMPHKNKGDVWGPTFTLTQRFLIIHPNIFSQNKFNHKQQLRDTKLPYLVR
jgi:hypothetical protein